MRNWLRRNSRKELRLDNWKVDELAGFEKNQNPDSVQYANAERGLCLYLSILTIQGKGPLTASVNARGPAITATGNGWELKGTKQHENELLVCVISVTAQVDLGWAKSFFNAITYKG